MARDGSGTFNLAEAAFVSGTTIESAKVNSNFSDIASGLTGSLAKDGQTTPTANLPMGGFKHTGAADGSSRTDYASLGQIAKGTVPYAADTGAADAYVIAPSPGIAANVVGFIARWKVANANLTTTPTLAVNGLTAGTIVWPDGTALAAGDLPANAIVETIIASLSSTTPTWHLQTVAKAGTLATAVQNGLLTTRGDIITRGASAPQRLAVGTNGQVLTSNGTDPAWSAPLLPRSYLAGLTLSAAGSTATFGIAAGQAANSTNAALMSLGSAYTKTTSAWALGTAAGALDTGAIANSTWYHVWLIQRSDTSVVDVLISLSASSPTMPTSYDRKRRIGSMKTNGSAQWVKFLQDGDLFQWDALVADVADTNPGTSLVTKTLTVPTGINVLASIIVDPVYASTGGVKFYAHDLGVSDEAASTANGFVNSTSSSAGQTGGWQGFVRTNTSAQIGYRLSASGASDVINITTTGWRDRRGKDS